MTSSVPAYISLVRPVNLLITFLSIVAAGILAGGGWTDAAPLLLAGAAGAAVAAGANAINDYFDVAIDRINRPERPIPSGTLSTGQAWWIWLTTSIGGCVCGLVIGPWPFAITVGSVLLLYWYSRALKSTPLAGNLVVGGMTGMAFIFGGVAIGAVDQALLPALFAFLVNVAREVVKDIEDREGDARQQAATLPVRFGIRSARLATSIVLLSLITITILAYLGGRYDEVYLRIVLVADVLLAYVAWSVWRKDTAQHMHQLSVVLKTTMIIGLAAIFFGRGV